MTLRKDGTGRDDYLSRTALRTERGWTDRLITNYLGEPDKTAINSRYRTGPRVQLFALERVIEAEGHQEVAAALAKAKAQRAGRSASAKAVADKKAAETMADIAGGTVKLRIYSREGLERAATRHYNQLWFERGEFRQVEKNPSPEFMARICVNFLRHQRTEYDKKIAKAFGRTGKHEAIAAMREKVMAQIAKAYPWLADRVAEDVAERKTA